MIEHHDPDECQALLRKIEKLARHNAELESLLAARYRPGGGLTGGDKRFEFAFEHSVIGMTLATPEGRYVRANRALLEMLGYTEQELRRLTYQEITHPDDLEEDVALADRLLAGDIPSYTLEKRYMRKDGSPLWCLLSVTVEPDARGRPDHFIAQIQDIGERKRAEEELEERRRFLRLVIDTAPCGVFLKDEASRFVLVNALFAENRGLLPADIEGLTEYDLCTIGVISAEDAERYADLDRKVIETQQRAFIPHEPVVGRDGRTRLYQTVKVPFTLYPDRPCVLSVSTDITDRVEAERERERLLIDLHDASAQVRRLSGLLPICAVCKKIRDDQGYWRQVEDYIKERAEVDFSHGICPDCMSELYPEMDDTGSADD